MTMSAAARIDDPRSGVVADAVADVIATELAPNVVAIDEGSYPETAMRRLGEAGAWRRHIPVAGQADLWPAIQVTSAVGAVCGASAFMGWCQNTLVWYVANTENAALRDRYLERVASGAVLGGTGLSNPMKTLFGIETLKLKATAGEGGAVTVRGALPWVSNLGADHLFGTVAGRGEDPRDAVMILADCAEPALEITPCAPFLGMDGTGTYALRFRDLPVPADMILADPSGPFIARIRAGFVLLQTGMGLGLIRDCVAIMTEARTPLKAINAYLDVQPEAIEAELDRLEAEIRSLAATPFDRSRPYWRRVIEARLATSELALKAAQAAMLHCGARGYVKGHRAQRRLREAYFVAIVTPATKQLRKMLALVDAEAASAAA